jgi:hypothetical protein
MKTTLNQIRAHGPCHDGWEKLLRGLGKTQADDDPLWIDQILDHNGLNDALWCLRSVEGCDREILMFALWCARRVQRNEASDEELASMASAWEAAEAAAGEAAAAAAGADRDAERAAQSEELRRICREMREDG